MPFMAAQPTVFDKSDWMNSMLTYLPLIYMSSAKMLQKNRSSPCRLLIMIRNKNGPTADPYETPLGARASFNRAMPMHSGNVLAMKKFLTQVITRYQTHGAASLVQRIQWLTMSTALLKSKKNRPMPKLSCSMH